MPIPFCIRFMHSDTDRKTHIHSTHVLAYIIIYIYFEYFSLFSSSETNVTFLIQPGTHTLAFPIPTYVRYTLIVCLVFYIIFFFIEKQFGA